MIHGTYKKKLIIIFSFLISCCSVNSQNVSVAGLFPTLDHSGELSSKTEYGIYYFAAFPMINFKTLDVKNDAYFNLLYLENALTYKFNTKFSATGSYVYQRENIVYNNYINENRFYIQAKYKHPFNKVNLTHRLRFDGRFIQNHLTKETPFTHRARYLIGLDVPINERVYFTTYEEVFFNTHKQAAVVYAENWAYAALGKKVNGYNKFEAGILYVTWNIGTRSWYNQYYVQITWINRLNFTKTKTQS